MLDIKYIIENKDEVKEAAKNKNIKVDIDKLLEIYEKRRELVQKSDDLRAQKNELSKQGKGGKPSPKLIEKSKKIKVDLGKIEVDLNKIDKEYMGIMVKVPTIPSKDTPIGKDESENVPVEEFGDKPKFSFKPKDHIQLGKDLDIIDIERGVKVSGYRGYYLKNEGVTLGMALMMLALEKLVLKGFTPYIPPTLVRNFALFGSGYFSGTEYNGEVDEIYKIANEEVEADGKKNKEDKFLVGTAEPSLLAYYSNEVLEEKNLPIKICGFSQCYRSEIGSYGKDTKGLYRVHEFMKVEQVSICPADIDIADKMHQEMIDISKELHEDLELPYRVLQICTGDMSAGKYKMFDLEAWMPSRDDWGETGSASNFLDWQARRLNVKYRTKNNEKKYVYMINNTALTTIRPLIAILENHQQKDGNVLIPKALQKYMPGGQKIIKIKKSFK